MVSKVSDGFLWFRMVSNGLTLVSKWNLGCFQVVSNVFEWLQAIAVLSDGFTWYQVVLSGVRWFRLIATGVWLFQVVKNCFQVGSRWFQVVCK